MKNEIWDLIIEDANLERETQNKGDNGGAATSPENDLEIHNLDEEFDGFGDELDLIDVGLDQNVLNDLLY